MVYSPLDALSLAADNPAQPRGLSRHRLRDDRARGGRLDSGGGKQRARQLLGALDAQGDASRDEGDPRCAGDPPRRHPLSGAREHGDGLRRHGEFLADSYHIPAAVAGFEPVDILLAILEIVRQCEEGKPRVANMYPRSVTPEGTKPAREMMERVFERGPACWRGLGAIPDSGLHIREEYGRHDATASLRGRGPGDGCGAGRVPMRRGHQGRHAAR